MITPGPWIAVDQCIDQFAPHPEGQRLLCSGYGNKDYSMFTEADCKLIAAAPELLAALQEMVKLAPAITQVKTGAYEQALAAIAKAVS